MYKIFSLICIFINIQAEIKDEFLGICVDYSVIKNYVWESELHVGAEIDTFYQGSLYAKASLNLNLLNFVGFIRFVGTLNNMYNEFLKSFDLNFGVDVVEIAKIKFLYLSFFYSIKKGIRIFIYLTSNNDKINVQGKLNLKKSFKSILVKKKSESEVEKKSESEKFKQEIDNFSQSIIDKFNKSINNPEEQLKAKTTIKACTDIIFENLNKKILNNWLKSEKNTTSQTTEIIKIYKQFLTPDDTKIHLICEISVSYKYLSCDLKPFINEIHGFTPLLLAKIQAGITIFALDYYFDVCIGRWKLERKLRIEEQLRLIKNMINDFNEKVDKVIILELKKGKISVD